MTEINQTEINQTEINQTETDQMEKTQIKKNHTEIPTVDIEITHEPVELYKILKFSGWVGSGGEAKAVISAGDVQVDGAVETQKRKKIVAGHTIAFGEQRMRIVRAAVFVESAEPDKTQKTAPEKRQITTQENTHEQQ